MAKKNGRPTRFTKKMGEKICEEIRNGSSLSKVCKPADMPHRSQVYRWLSMPSLKNFRDMFKLAVVERTEAFAEDIIDIADDGENDTFIDDNGNMRTDHDVIQRSKLRVETRLKLMGKMNPRKYGDKLDLTSKGKRIKQPVQLFDMRAGKPAPAKKVAQPKTPAKP